MGTQPETAANPKIAVTSVKIPQTKLDALREIAEHEHRSVSAQIRYLIDRCLEAEREAEGAAAA